MVLGVVMVGRCGPFRLPPRSYRRKLLDGLVASLALKPIPAKKLLNSLKVTLTPGPTQTLYFTARTSALSPQAPGLQPFSNLGHGPSPAAPAQPPRPLPHSFTTPAASKV